MLGFGRWTKKGRRRHAMEALRYELIAFSGCGLARLREDLAGGFLAQRQDEGFWPWDWSDCPLSYRYGKPGSAEVDAHGHSSNDFTRAWDAGLLSAADVLALVDAEIEYRGLRTGAA